MPVPLSAAQSCSYQCCDQFGHSVCPSILRHHADLHKAIEGLLNNEPGAREFAQSVLDADIPVNETGG